MTEAFIEMVVHNVRTGKKICYFDSEMDESGFLKRFDQLKTEEREEPYSDRIETT
jgi:hypothetical protein